MRIPKDSTARRGTTVRVAGHQVLITGGSAGIGFALARAFLERDNQVAICGRNSDRLSAAQQQLPGLHAIQCDIAKDEDLRRLVETTVTALGGISLLVNNAGIQLNYDFSTVESAALLHDIETEMGINLTAALKLTGLCLPLLRGHSASAVVNISSVLAIVPKQSAPVYCATKAALHSFSKALRYQLEEVSPRVLVFEVLPPLVDTAMTKGRGNGKITPQQVAEEVLCGLERDRREILVGRARALALIHRWVPKLAERIVRRV